MNHVTSRLTAKNRDQLRNPTLGNRVWATLTFLVCGVVKRQPKLAAREGRLDLQQWGCFGRGPYCPDNPRNAENVTSFRGSKAISEEAVNFGIASPSVLLLSADSAFCPADLQLATECGSRSVGDCVHGPHSTAAPADWKWRTGQRKISSQEWTLQDETTTHQLCQSSYKCSVGVQSHCFTSHYR